MIDLETLMSRLRYNRQQTERFIFYLEAVIRQEADERGISLDQAEEDVLSADPTEGTGAIGWQLMHIAASEDEAFGPTERADAWQRYQHGEGHHADQTLGSIKRALETERSALLAASMHWDDGLLDVVPAGLEHAGRTYRQLLDSLAWHEPYHLNQCNEVLRAMFVA